MFDRRYIFNSKSKFGKGSKQPINCKTIDEYSKFYKIAHRYYVCNLQIFSPALKKLINSPSKTGFLGFLVTIEFFKLIYEDFCLTGKLEYILKI